MPGGPNTTELEDVGREPKRDSVFLFGPPQDHHGRLLPAASAFSLHGEGSVPGHLVSVGVAKSTGKGEGFEGKEQEERNTCGTGNPGPHSKL